MKKTQVMKRWALSLLSTLSAMLKSVLSSAFLPTSVQKSALSPAFLPTSVLQLTLSPVFLSRFLSTLVLSLLCMFVFSLTTSAQSERMQKLAVHIDTTLANRRMVHVDSNYISYPERKLLVSTGFVNSWTINEIFLPLYFDNDILERFPGIDRYQYTRVRNHTYTSGITFKVNYSGLSLGYTAIVSDGGNHQDLEVASNGRKIGFRAGVRRYELDNSTISDYRLLVPMLCAKAEAHEAYNVDDVAKECETHGVDDQVDMLEWYASAYYVFNHRKFCMGATVNPNVTQRRSAGSIILAADMSSCRLHANNILLNEREKYSSFAMAMGAGYGYNWTPNGGRLLMHVCVMPVVNLYTHIGFDAFAYHRNSATGVMEWERVKQNENIPIVSRHKVSLAMSGIVRLGLSYNFTSRLVGSTNIECSVRNKNSNSSGCYTFYTRMVGNVMFGYRF